MAKKEILKEYPRKKHAIKAAFAIVHESGVKIFKFD